MNIVGYQQGSRIAPLTRLSVTNARGTNFSVADGRGEVYASGPFEEQFSFTTAGALGVHAVKTFDEQGILLDSQTFQVDARTAVADQGGLYQDLLQMLYLTMVGHPEYKTIRYQGRLYSVFVPWLRDHVHVMKGMKYFNAALQDGIDLYRDSQREDGMIWDNFHERLPAFAGPDHWSVRFSYGGFHRLFDDCTAEFTRIPVENDVEYLFVEGLYYTWKATGDDAWMGSCLDAAKRALEYSVTSPYRWSEKFRLLKRGHTIDTWDFQNEEDCLTDIVGWPDPMAILPEKTRFGIMFGDNTGYAAGCFYLAEMLEHLGRADEAAPYRQRGAEILERLNQVSWNGRFFTHHVPEREEYHRDLGVDEATQLSLSNAYSLNRPITHEQSAAIIRAYMDLKEHLPEGSPGEWYTIYPPYQKGYGGHNAIWQYMNSSVTPIVAGELAHGAFQHGFETYGVDILKRLSELGKQHRGLFHCSYTGAFPTPPARTFTSLVLDDFLNASIPAELFEPLNGQPFPVGDAALVDVPFQIHPTRQCAVLGEEANYSGEITIPVGARAGALYFLHTANRIENPALAGTIILEYADGTHHAQTVINGREILPWSHWMQLAPGDSARIAWNGVHVQQLNMQVVAYGMNNPHPEREIKAIRLVAAPGRAQWQVYAITLSDREVYFRPGPISFGIPDNWGAAAVVYALVEGLAGVVDRGTTFDTAAVEPRWCAARVDAAEVTIRYPASDGYVTYRYQHDRAAHTIRLELTGSGRTAACHVLLPQEAQSVRRVTLNGAPAQAQTVRVEDSLYAELSVPLNQAHALEVVYE